MFIKLFTIPITDSGTLQSEFNRFVASHRVLKIEQQFMQMSSGAAWCFCVSYISGANEKNAAFSKERQKKDYKTVLDSEEFSKFSLLRSIRKEVAQSNAVPAYVVFTDAELAEISKLKEISTTNIIKINGIGENRMEKYGNQVVELYLTQSKLSDEKI